MYLSIIIPVHNAEKYICDCIESCLAQDISREDYEIICVDDCSTDNSLALLRKYEKENSNIHVVPFEKNRGVSAARNAGLNIMRGDYCLFLDGDDFLLDNCFSRINELCANSNKNTIICVGQYRFSEQGRTNRHEYYDMGQYFGCPTERYLTNRIIPAGLAQRFRFCENVAYGEDEVFSLELKLLDPTFVVVDEPIYFYRIHENSAMSFTKTKRIKRLNSVINSAFYIRKKYGLSKQDCFDFFAERNKIAIKEIVLLPLYREIVYLFYMKLLNLVVFRKNDSKGRGSFLDFWDRKYPEIKNNIYELIVAYGGRIKRFFFGQKPQ